MVCGVWASRIYEMGLGFSVGGGDVAEEEGHPYQLGWQNFAYGLLHGREGSHRDSQYLLGGWYHSE